MENLSSCLTPTSKESQLLKSPRSSQVEDVILNSEKVSKRAVVFCSFWGLSS